MIKRVLFDAPAPPGDPSHGGAPLGASVCESLVGGAPHATLVTEWFADRAHLERWTAVTGEPSGLVFVGEEVVMRGADWLERYRRVGGVSYKHMALAARAPGLDLEEFSARWKARAGMVGNPASTAVQIPAAVRGLAYVQNHPLGPERCPYDAVNEVWFDDDEALAVRARWFDENLAGGAEDDLVTSPTFLSVRETLLRLDGGDRLPG